MDLHPALPGHHLALEIPHQQVEGVGDCRDHDERGALSAEMREQAAAGRVRGLQARAMASSSSAKMTAVVTA